MEPADAPSPSATLPKPPKSPPLAFEKTSNDALVPPSQAAQYLAYQSGLLSPPIGKMHDFSPPASSDIEWESQTEKLTEALHLQHQGFMAERESWKMERERLYRRVASLESLLKSANGHSPARSPLISPSSGHSYTSPSHRSSNPLSRLASIAEDATPSHPSPDKTRVSFLKREAAPVHIDLPSAPGLDGSVALDSGIASEILTEIPASPPQSRVGRLSPPPLANRHLAGHTPLKAPPIAGDASPSTNSLSDKLADTPTRSNTHQNTMLAATNGSEEEDEDRALSGPLNMPELPNVPGEINFTMEMLDRKLKDVEEHPESNRPLVMQVPSPGLYREGEDYLDEKVWEPTATAAPESKPADAPSDSVSSSQVLSPSASQLAADEAARSPSSRPEQEDGGIKLRKKPSTNFGAPFGQLGPMCEGFRKF